MSLKLVLGRAGSGKTVHCLEEMTELVRQEPRGVPLILLVPEQSTLLMEKTLAHNSAGGGMMRAQVLSFQRLVRRLFNEVRGGCRVRIDEVGRLVMLTKILLDHRHELRCFAPMAASPGLAESVSHMITELRTYRVFPHDLLNEMWEGKGVLADKLHDVALIYRCYNEATLGSVHDWDQDMEEALALLPEGRFLRGSLIWVDGFKGFTPQELAMLAGLLGVCGGMTVTLPLDPEMVVKGTASGGSLFSSNGRIFESVLATYQELRDVAMEAEVLKATGVWTMKERVAGAKARLDSPVFLSANKRSQHPMLAYLERHFGGYPVIPYGEDDGESSPLEIHVHEDMRSEVVAAVRRIWVLARDHGYQWREMAVMTRGLAEYRQVLEQEFQRHGIPFFMDDKRRIQGHPLLTLIQALLNLARRRWQLEDVFCALRTGFFPFDLDAVDRLENLCLATRVRAEDWERGRLWFDDDDDDDYDDYENDDYESGGNKSDGYEADDYESDDDKDDVSGGAGISWQRRVEGTTRRTFRQVSVGLRPLVSALIQGEQAGISVRELGRLLLGFLEGLLVQDCLETWAEACEGDGDFVGAQVHRQIWQHMLALIEQMDTLLGEAGLSLAEYGHIVDSGLRSIQLGVVPPRLDEVMVGSINRTRLPDIKVVLLIGCVQGILPPEPGNAQGLFDAQERLTLREAGINLEVKGKKEFDEELFYIYSVLAAPTDKLILSYPLSLNGSFAAPSFLVAHLRRLFPKAPFVNDVEGRQTRETGGQAREGYTVLSHELALLETYIDRQGIVSNKNSVYEKWLLEKSSVADVLGRVLAQVKGAGNGGSEDDVVPRVLTRMLYGQPFVTSVSQTQLFARCPFAHFIHYGLRGRERKIYRLEASDAGIFSHALMNEYARMLFRAGENWFDIPEAEKRKRLGQIAENLVRQPDFAPLVREARHRFMLNRQKTVLAFSVDVMSEQARAGDFVTIGVEMSFGDRGLLPALRIPLEFGDELVLRGQIDRIDMARVANRDYVRVVDYKARPQKVDLEEIRVGLDLQLPLYLEVALNAGSRIAGSRIAGSQAAGSQAGGSQAAGSQAGGSQVLEPGGLAYFALIEPVIEVSSFVGEEEIACSRRKNARMESLMYDDPRVAEAFGEHQLVKRDGAINEKACLSAGEFADLRGAVRSHLRHQGEQIMAGCVSAIPARSSKTQACRYCGFHSICGFDPTLPGFNYRYVTGEVTYGTSLDTDTESRH
ncbi:MAG: exodeoxyribonuclease V subunit gamma [Peptococcaceae bacterium]|nr:exodeoxyribonuclease V subunit gamma [Peptococcaceae bacterium]